FAIGLPLKMALPAPYTELEKIDSMKNRLVIHAVLLLISYVPRCVHAADSGAQAGLANKFVELTFTARQQREDPFNTVTVDVVFTDPNGRELRVPAFWDGGAEGR